ncbi:MAG: hypothetical protein WCT07_03980 [Candidatus Paceibacterota bacterium]|jgi:hypothetical protein
MIKINTCPVCGNELFVEITNNPVGILKRSISNGTSLISATCFHPNSKDPLHYYGNFSDAKYPDVVLFDEFSINIGNKYVMFSNVYMENRSLIWSKEGSDSIGLPFIIEPDYPNLTSLKKKVRLSITFA